MVVSNKVSFGKKKGFICFTGYKDAKKGINAYFFQK